MDAKGRGGANATANFRLEPSTAGSIVLIDTDLNLSGSVAQYGRGAGMIQTIAAQLINQFAKTLEKQIAQSAPVVALATPATPASSNGNAKLEAATPPVPRPIGGFSLVMQALWAGIVGMFRGNGRK
jgi:uncharacterized protein